MASLTRAGTSRYDTDTYAVDSYNGEALLGPDVFLTSRDGDGAVVVHSYTPLQAYGLAAALIEGAEFALGKAVPA